MKIPKIKEDESLAAWRDRLSKEFNLDYKMQELLREVSVTSYIHGTDVTLEILKMEEKASPWKTIINGNPVPDTGRPVVGYWICDPEPFIEIVTHDPESGEWQDLDASGCEQHNMKEPDYWIDLPDHDEY